MEYLRKFGAFLKHFYDKIILALLLMGLATVMVSESCHMQEVNREIAVGGEIPNLPTGQIEPLDVSTIDAQLEVPVSSYWQPGPRVTLAARYQIPTMSLSLRKFLNDYGEGSLLDPVVYVYSSHDRTSVMHYTTELNPVTGQREDRSREGDDVGDDDDDDDTTPEPVGKPLIEYAKLYKLVQQPLPIMLRRITVNDPTDKSSWLMQIDVWDRQGRRMSRFKRLGDTIDVPGSDKTYKVLEVEYEVVDSQGGIPQERSSVVLQDSTTNERISLPRNTRKSMGTVAYELAVLPPPKWHERARSVKTELDNVFSISLKIDGNDLKTEYYKLIEAGNDSVTAVQTDQTGRQLPDVDPFVVPKLTQNEFEKWRQDYRSEMRKQSTQQAPDMMEPIMPPN